MEARIFPVVLKAAVLHGNLIKVAAELLLATAN
jgi:hypothetical protein